MKCFYHNDGDGKGAARIVYMYHIEVKYDTDFIEMTYEKPFPFDIVSPYETVYIVDFSISPEEMGKLLTITSNVVWIDHHKTSIAKYRDFPQTIKGIRYDGIAGCMLTYLYFNCLHVDMQVCKQCIKQAPMWLQYLADWDVWKFEFGDNTKYYQIAFNAFSNHPVYGDWDLLEDHKFMIDQGIPMKRYRDAWSAEYLKELGFEAILDGIHCYVVNIGKMSSDFFDSIIKDYPMMASFVFDGKGYKVGLRSKDHVDVSEIASRHGGGGHKNAAGFYCEELPFDVLDLKEHKCDLCIYDFPTCGATNIIFGIGKDNDNVAWCDLYKHKLIGK